MRVIYKQGPYRIIERIDQSYDFDDLCGDMYKPDANPDMPVETLERELNEFRALVEQSGVYGYALQHWDASVDAGWIDINSCYGFVGQFDETDDQFNHYIVDELKRQIREVQS